LTSTSTDAVNGNWGVWSEWSECSERKYCNRGEKTRKRECNNPKPKEGGDRCPGTNSDKIECPKQNCVGRFTFTNNVAVMISFSE
jgi:hypothetical protein